MTIGTLVLLRHGESEWNAMNLFTGWVDVHLTDKGIAEGKRAGALLAEHNVLPDVSYTSLLRRAISTANFALDAADRHWIPVIRDWRLNERHYGALQGKNKSEIKDEFGEEQFMLWRRSYDTPPPPIEPGSKYSQDTDPRYADVDEVPLTECLKDVVARFIRTGSRRSPRICSRARRCWSPRTATRCARSSSISTGSPTTTSPDSTSRRASRCATTSTRTCAR